ncbi:MAG: type II toxin-antitoxin system RelB/DinJ family antitoxin [Deltaproteobacteria bacterium]|nr:type II toxin-antitoxin system RelB/DinJ family antitoxin [Deltaproteobacteria bacterium]
MAIHETVIRSRIDPGIKKKANHVLGRMGLSMSDAIRLFLYQVAAERALPFFIEAPNARTVAAMRSADKGEGLRKITLEQLKKEWDEA